MPRVPAAAAVVVVVAFCIVFNTLRYPGVWEMAGDLFGASAGSMPSEELSVANKPEGELAVPTFIATKSPPLLSSPPSTDATSADSPRDDSTQWTGRTAKPEMRAKSAKPICSGNVCFMPGAEPDCDAVEDKEPHADPLMASESSSISSSAQQAKRDNVTTEKKRPAEKKQQSEANVRSKSGASSALPPEKPQRMTVALRDLVPVVASLPTSSGGSLSPSGGDMAKTFNKDPRNDFSATVGTFAAAVHAVEQSKRVRHLPQVDERPWDAQSAEDSSPGTGIPFYPVTAVP